MVDASDVEASTTIRQHMTRGSPVGALESPSVPQIRLVGPPCADVT